MRVIIALQPGGKLPGHVDTYDAIALTDDFEEIGLYQSTRNPNWFSNPVMGLVVDRDEIEI
jgi:hypothetical protein